MRPRTPALLLVLTLLGGGCALRPIWNPPGNSSSDAGGGQSADAAFRNDQDSAGIVSGSDASSDAALMPAPDGAPPQDCDPTHGDAQCASDAAATDVTTDVTTDATTDASADATADVTTDATTDASADASGQADAAVDASAGDVVPGDPSTDAAADDAAADDAAPEQDGEVGDAAASGEGGP
jgi:hypothetical protein